MTSQLRPKLMSSQAERRNVSRPSRRQNAPLFSFNISNFSTTTSFVEREKSLTGETFDTSQSPHPVFHQEALCLTDKTPGFFAHCRHWFALQWRGFAKLTDFGELLLEGRSTSTHTHTQRENPQRRPLFLWMGALNLTRCSRRSWIGVCQS